MGPQGDRYMNYFVHFKPAGWADYLEAVDFNRQISGAKTAWAKAAPKRAELRRELDRLKAGDN